MRTIRSGSDRSNTLVCTPVSTFGAPGPYPGQFTNIHVIASDSKGNVYVGDGGGRFQKFIYQGMSTK